MVSISYFNDTVFLSYDIDQFKTLMSEKTQSKRKLWYSKYLTKPEAAEGSTSSILEQCTGDTSKSIYYGMT